MGRDSVDHTLIFGKCSIRTFKTSGSVGTLDFIFRLAKRFSYMAQVPGKSSDLSGRRTKFLYLISDVCAY